MYFDTCSHLHYSKHAIYSIGALTFKHFDSIKHPYVYIYICISLKALNFVPTVPI